MTTKKAPKIIFLDIDGVLYSPRLPALGCTYDASSLVLDRLESDRLETLAKVCIMTGAQVVPIDWAQRADGLREKLAAYRIPVYDIPTKREPGLFKQDTIAKLCKKEKIKKYVIITQSRMYLPDQWEHVTVVDDYHYHQGHPELDGFRAGIQYHLGLVEYLGKVEPKDIPSYAEVNRAATELSARLEEAAERLAAVFKDCGL